LAYVVRVLLVGIGGIAVTKSLIKEADFGRGVNTIFVRERVSTLFYLL